MKSDRYESGYFQKNMGRIYIIVWAKIYKVSKSIPAAKSQNFVDNLGQPKPHQQNFEI